MGCASSKPSRHGHGRAHARPVKQVSRPRNVQPPNRHTPGPRTHPHPAPRSQPKHHHPKSTPKRPPPSRYHAHPNRPAPPPSLKSVAHHNAPKMHHGPHIQAHSAHISSYARPPVSPINYHGKISTSPVSPDGPFRPLPMKPRYVQPPNLPPSAHMMAQSSKGREIRRKAVPPPRGMVAGPVKRKPVGPPVVPTIGGAWF